MNALTTVAERLQTRRRFVQRVAGLGVSGFGLGLLAACAGQSRLSGPVGPEPPPETTRLKLHHALGLCLAPQYVAEGLLRAEGFDEVTYARPEDTGGVYAA